MNEKIGRHSLGKSIEILAHKIAEYETKILEKTELTSLSGKQIHYLGEIHRKGNPTITELAENLCVSKPSVSVIVEKLIRKGLVDKVQSVMDKRTYHLHLTKSGRKCAVFHDSIHGRFAAKVKKILDGKEVEQLSVLLYKIIDRLA